MAVMVVDNGRIGNGETHRVEGIWEEAATSSHEGHDESVCLDAARGPHAATTDSDPARFDRGRSGGGMEGACGRNVEGAWCAARMGQLPSACLWSHECCACRVGGGQLPRWRSSKGCAASVLATAVLCSILCPVTGFLPSAVTIPSTSSSFCSSDTSRALSLGGIPVAVRHHALPLCHSSRCRLAPRMMATTPDKAKKASPATPKKAAAKKSAAKAKAKSSPPTPKEAVVEPCAARDVWRYALTSDRSIAGANDVLTFRHREYGTGIELWQGSFGWFDFMHCGEADVTLCDSWGVQMARNTKEFSVPGLYERLGEEIAKGQGDSLAPGVDLSVGSWAVTQRGDQIVISNKHSPRQRLLLREEGFVFIGSRSKGIRVEHGGEAFDCDVRDVLGLLPVEK